ncbi:MoaD/ThiS family protein [Spirochaetota bacterium]
MKIRIKTFASIKEACNFEEKEITASDNSSVNDIIEQLSKDYECFIDTKNTLLYAINENYCSLETVLNDDDVLAIFPPVSGG